PARANRARHALPRGRTHHRAGCRRRAQSGEPGVRAHRRGRAHAAVRGAGDREGRTMMVRAFRLAAGLAVAGLLAPVSAQDDRPARVDHARLLAAEPAQWMAPGRTYDEQRFSPLDRINDRNVGRLGLAWY